MNSTPQATTPNAQELAEFVGEYRFLFECKKN